MNNWLFLSILIAHIVGDFFLQTDKLCEAKNTKKFRSLYLYIHPLIVGLLAWGIIWSLDFWPYALILAVTHLIIDAIKIQFKSGLAPFLIDQLFHLVIIVWVVCNYNVNGQLPLELFFSSGYTVYLLFAVACLICLKPTNILIKLVLDDYKIGINNECSEIKNAGALIGNLERILSLIFIVLGQYEVIGFIIAAKSLLRFKETDIAKTEYVLAGTFLSFGVAIVCGILILKSVPVL